LGSPLQWGRASFLSEGDSRRSWLEMVEDSVHSQRIADRFIIRDLEQDLLGRGSMGEVYRATDTHTGEPVAVKALDPRVVARDPGILERFVREGEALRQLDHPNIVRMVAAVEEEEATTGVVAHYLVMEYVAGGSLHDLLQAQGALPTPVVLEIALELADALTRAHHLGIIHRDLKPANVLLAEDGTPRLTDFGIAYMADTPRLTQTGVLVGTVDYLSPEACEGEPIDERGDIWSFGVMLYEMLIGERPFGGKSLTATLTAILTQTMPDLGERRPEAPEALVDLVYRMLEKDPQQRIPSVRLVGAELEAILEGREIPTPVRSAPGESRFATLTPPAGAPPHNLPVQPTPFVGREAELAELARLLADPDVRLLTILGAGGMGKTRLALEAAAAELNNFEDGVCFVALAPLKSPEAIVPTVAKALGFRFYEGGEPRQQLLDYLRQKAKLILMDNYEHLLDGVRLVGDLLKSAPRVKILSTSRARLKVQGEHLFHLTGMNYPEPLPQAEAETPEGALDYSAVKLLLQSARRVNPGFELIADDLKYVARICRLVGGMPLGILLAASWLEMLTPGEIADEIEANLDFLETDLCDVPERQRSMRAAFDHSWNLLTERQRSVMQALSVFRGGFTRVAAQEATGASLRELRALVHKSLLGRGPAGRYGIHELLRQYAQERLELTPALGRTVRDRHSVYYAAALKQWGKDLKGSHQQTALAEMDLEIQNARTAWDWAVEQEAIENLQLALEGLCLFYDWRLRHQEGEAACRAAAERLVATESDDRWQILVPILAWQVALCSTLGRREATARHLRQSLARLERSKLDGPIGQWARAHALWALADVAADSDREQSRRLWAQSLELFQALGDQWWTARVLSSLGWAAWQLGAYDEAQRLHAESLAIRQALDDQRGIGKSVQLLSYVPMYRGNAEEAEHLVRESLAIHRESGNPSDIAEALLDLGCTVSLRGKYPEAHSLHEQAVAIYDELGSRRKLAWSNVWLCLVKVHLGRYEGAHALARTAFEVAQECGDQEISGFSLYVLGNVALAGKAYTEAGERLRESVITFQQIGQQHELAMAQASLGYAERALGQSWKAERHVSAGLRIAHKLGVFRPLMLALPASALLLADLGQVERAVELYALASRFPFMSNSCWFEEVAGQHIAVLAATLPPEAVAAAQARGRARDLDATVAELLDELEGSRTDSPDQPAGLS
jgi:predicted ATPase